MATPVNTPAPVASGSLWTRKYGPLPAYVWAAGVLGLVILFVLWRRSRSASSATATATAQDATNALGDQGAPPIFIVPQAPVPSIQVTPTTPVTTNVNIPPPATVPPAPAGGGRTNPPGTPPPVPTPPGVKVKVVPFTSTNPPWNSTISGIAAHYKIPSWQTVWNDPLNADLRKRRGQPNRIQAGDFVFVRGVR